MTKSFCRVYTNWWSVDPISGCYNTSIRARIADKVTPSSMVANSTASNDGGNMSSITAQMEVIELLCPDVPIQIACCQLTGNILVSTATAAAINCKSTLLLLYKFQSCVSDATKLPYIDFKQVPVAIELDFQPDHINMVEQCVACGNTEFAMVFKLIETDASAATGCNPNSVSINVEDAAMSSATTDDTENSSNTSSSSSCFSSDSECRKNASIGLDLEKWRLEECAVQLTSTMDSSTKVNVAAAEHSARRQFSYSDLRPIHIDMCCRLVANGLQNRHLRDFHLKPLLRIRHRDPRDPFRCIALAPIYLQRRHVVKSSTAQLLGLTVAVATANDGYVYQFSNNDDWVTETDNFLAVYPFTAAAREVALADFVLHALTDRGIETYTLRSSHRIFGSPFEYNLLDDNGSSNAAEDLHSPLVESSPRIDDPICLIGLRPFLGIRRMLCADKTLVLLAAAAAEPNEVSSTSSWTVYTLRLPSAADLYADFKLIAEQHLPDSPATYALLMSEAHMIVRLASCLHHVRRHGERAEVRGMNGHISTTILSLFTDSCALLADFCVTSGTREEYSQAFGYYSMAGLAINEIYERAMRFAGTLSHDNKREVNMFGLVHTIKNCFLKANINGVGDQMNRILNGICSGTAGTLGDEIVRLFLDEARDELAVLTLRSPGFRDVLGNKVCQFFIFRNVPENNKTLRYAYNFYLLHRYAMPSLRNKTLPMPNECVSSCSIYVKANQMLPVNYCY